MSMMSGVEMGLGASGALDGSAPQAMDPNAQIAGLLGGAGQNMLGYSTQAGQQLGNLQLGYNAQAAKQALGLQGAVTQAGINAQNQQRGAGVAAMNQYGGAYNQALGSASPVYGATQSALMGGLQGNQALMGGLNQSAQQQLALGTSLAPDQERQVDQTTNQQFADRGMAQSNGAIAQDAMNRTNYGLGLQQQRMQNAEGVQQLGQQNTAALNNVGLSSLSPVTSFVNGQAGYNPATGSSISNGPNVMSAGSQLMNPLLGYGNSIYSTNYDAAFDQDMANQNTNDALIGGALASAGSGGGTSGGAGGAAGMASMCV